MKGTRYLQLTEGYITKMYLDKDDQVCGYEFVHMGKFMDAIKKGVPAEEALKSVHGFSPKVPGVPATYGTSL